MKYYKVPFFKGVNFNLSPRLIDDESLTEAINLIIDDLKLVRRYGTAEIGVGLPLQLKEKIIEIIFFEKLDGTKYLIIFTIKDVFEYNLETFELSFMTELDSTGTINPTGASVTVITGSGVTWDTTKDALNTYAIKIGTTDPENINYAWRVVESIDSSSQLTLAEPITTGTSEPYVLRYCLRDSDYISYAYPFDDATGDKIIVFTNGQDNIKKITNDLQIEDLGGSPPKAKYLHFSGSVGFEHLLAGNIIDGSNEYTQRIEFTNAGAFETWDGYYVDLLDTSEPIEGFASVRDQIAVFKKSSITLLTGKVGGGNADPFHVDQNKINGIGSQAQRTIQNIGGLLLFLGKDDLYLFDGLSVSPVGGVYRDKIFNTINRDKIWKSFAFLIEEKKLYCLCVPTDDNDDPNICYVYNYEKNFWNGEWDFDKDIYCASPYLSLNATAWDELTSTTWDTMLTQKVRWDDLLFYEDTRRRVFGTTDGNVLKFDFIYEQDEDVDIDSSFTTKDYALNNDRQDFVLCELIVAYVNKVNTGVGNNFKFRVSIDFGENYSDWITVDNSSDSTEYYKETILNYMQRGKQIRFQFSNIDSSNFELESFILSYNDGGI